MSYDIQIRAFTSRFDWRTFWRFGFAHYGCWRYLRIGKLGVRLWRIS